MNPVPEQSNSDYVKDAVQNAILNQADKVPELASRIEEVAANVNSELGALQEQLKTQKDLTEAEVLAQYQELAERIMQKLSKVDPYIFTVRNKDTIWDIATQFERDGKPVSHQELIDYNKDILKDPKAILQCQFIRIPADWKLKEDASFEYRDSLSRESWPQPDGEHSACPFPEYIQAENDSAGILPFLDDGDLAALAVYSSMNSKDIKFGPLINEPPLLQESAEPVGVVINMSKLNLQKGDIVTYANFKGEIQTAEFYAYTRSGTPQLIWGNNPNPRYAMDARSIVRVERGGKIMNLNELRLNKYGLQQHELMALARKRLTAKEIKQFEHDLKNPDTARAVSAVLTNPKYAKYEKFVKNFKKYGSLAFVCAVIYGLENSDDKIDFLLDTSVSTVGFMSAVKGVDILVGNKVVHPLFRLGIDLIAGFSLATLGHERYKAQIRPLVNEYLPNRNQNTVEWKTTLDVIQTIAVIGGASFEVAEYLAEKAGITGGVDENTDPLNYLSKSVTMASTGSFHEGLFSKYYLRSLSMFSKEAAEALQSAEKEFDQEKDPIKRTELAQKVKKLSSFIQLAPDGRPVWMHNKRAELAQQKQLIDFLTLSFADKLEVRFKGRGANFMKRVADRLKNGGELYDPADQDIWSYAQKTNVNFMEAEVSFGDYLDLVPTQKIQSAMIESLFERGKLEGKSL